MKYEKKIVEEINAVLDRLANERQPLIAKWVTQEVCANHKDGLVENDHKAFWQTCGYNAVREKVRRSINRRADDNPKTEKPDQFILPGYAHVHEYYTVARNGEEQAIHIDNMTDHEIEEKIKRYRSMGSACFEHAKELQRFKFNRKGMAA